jgi:hypothetical protein
MEQLFLLDVFDTVRTVKRTVKTRAWKHEVMEIQNGIPDPDDFRRDRSQRRQCPSAAQGPMAEGH